MKKFLGIFILAVILCTGVAQAGGVWCKECPAEDSNCMALPGCEYEGDDKCAPPPPHNYFDQCPANSAAACNGLEINSACVDGSHTGTCQLTPLTAGGFCMCYSVLN